MKHISVAIIDHIPDNSSGRDITSDTQTTFGAYCTRSRVYLSERSSHRFTGTMTTLAGIVKNLPSSAIIGNLGQELPKPQQSNEKLNDVGCSRRSTGFGLIEPGIEIGQYSDKDKAVNLT